MIGWLNMLFEFVNFVIRKEFFAMHIKRISSMRPQAANIRHNLEVVLLFLDVIHSIIAIINKTPIDDDHDHDHDHGHTH